VYLLNGYSDCGKPECYYPRSSVVEDISYGVSDKPQGTEPPVDGELCNWFSQSGRLSQSYLLVSRN